MIARQFVSDSEVSSGVNLKMYKNVSADTRRRMQRVRQSGTDPELIVRSALHSLGYRFRVNVASLPGKPDIVFFRRRKILFVHGCFWHGHDHCKRSAIPAANRSTWKDKIRKNRERDLRVAKQLIDDGWHVAIVWECQLNNRTQLIRRLRALLGPQKTR